MQNGCPFQRGTMVKTFCMCFNSRLEANDMNENAQKVSAELRAKKASLAPSLRGTFILHGCEATVKTLRDRNGVARNSE